MKKIVLSGFILFFATIAAIGQNTKWDARLEAKFSTQELQTMAPDQLGYWNYFVANAFQITELPQGKASSPEIRSEIELKDQRYINVFALGFAPELKNYQYYKIKGTNKLLVILSEEVIKANYQKQLSTNKKSK